MKLVSFVNHYFNKTVLENQILIMKTNPIVLFLLILVFAACKKEEPSDPNPDPEVLQIDTIPSHWSRNGEIVGELIYDNKGRLAEIRSYPGTMSYENKFYDAIAEFEYDSSDKLISAFWAADGNLQHNAAYFYSGNDLDSIIINVQGGDYKIAYLMATNSTGDCLPQSYEKNSYYRFGQPTFTQVTYEYSNEDCDYIVTGIEDGEFIYKNQVVKSDKRDFYTDVWSTSLFNIAFPDLNKYVKSERCILDEDGNVVQCNSNLLDRMEFNDLGFITKEITTSNRGDELVFEYFYK